jgi:hypothetical protein
VTGDAVAADERKIVMMVPVADLADGEVAAVAAAELPSVVKVLKNGGMADEDAIFRGDVGGEEGEEALETLGGDQGVAFAFAGVVAPTGHGQGRGG